jgi:uncharacterized protein YecA (UPF0149 family)
MGMLKGIMRYFAPEECGDPAKRPGRNEPCWCGSGMKYKKCHLPADDKKRAKGYGITCGPS